MTGHENIINIRNVIRAYGDRDLYITFDYLDTDLSHVIKAKILTVSVFVHQTKHLDDLSSSVLTYLRFLLPLSL